MRDPSPVPHLGDDKLAGDQQRPQQVVSAVVSHFVDGNLKTKHASEGNPALKRCASSCAFSFAEVCVAVVVVVVYLRAGEDDWLAQVFTHEGEGGGRVRHRVRAVKNHKSVIVLVVFLRTQKGCCLI